MKTAISTQNNHNRVLVGLSGGVDSAVSCKILQENGYETTGLFLIMSDLHLKPLAAAEKAAEDLKIELVVKDLRECFREYIILPFMQAYCNGITPNPCVICNEAVKFSALSHTAEELHYDYTATGHYAGIDSVNDYFLLKTAADSKKDQSYMLYRLGQKILEKHIFPLSGITKTEVKSIAEAENISAYNAAESQEICFIEDKRYPEYLHENGFYGRKGYFILESGRIAGLHKGVEYYTIGQRKGLSVNLGHPAYVKKIYADGNILLGLSNEAYVTEIEVSDIVTNPYFDLNDGNEYLCKVRYQSRPEIATARLRNGKIYITFNKAVKSPALGQSAVLYRDDYVAGGGIISETF